MTYIEDGDFELFIDNQVIFLPGAQIPPDSKDFLILYEGARRLISSYIKQGYFSSSVGEQDGYEKPIDPFLAALDVQHVDGGSITIPKRMAISATYDYNPEQQRLIGYMTRAVASDLKESMPFHAFHIPQIVRYLESNRAKSFFEAFNVLNERNPILYDSKRKTYFRTVVDTVVGLDNLIRERNSNSNRNIITDRSVSHYPRIVRPKRSVNIIYDPSVWEYFNNEYPNLLSFEITRYVSINSSPIDGRYFHRSRLSDVINLIKDDAALEDDSLNYAPSPNEALVMMLALCVERSIDSLGQLEGEKRRILTAATEMKKMTNILSAFERLAREGDEIYVLPASPIHYNEQYTDINTDILKKNPICLMLMLNRRDFPELFLERT